RQRHDEEENADHTEDDGCEAERVQGHDPEGEVDGRGNLAVGNGCERRSVQHALQPRQLSSHLSVSLTPPQEIQPRAPERDEEHTEEIAGRASAQGGGLDEERDPEHDCQEREDVDRTLVQADQAARSRGVATMTRHGALRRTKSTESPKICRRPRCSCMRLGPAMTMISESRRIASSTI